MVNVMNQNNKVLAKIARNEQLIEELEAQVRDLKEAYLCLLTQSQLLDQLVMAMRANGFITEAKHDLQVINGGKS